MYLLPTGPVSSFLVISDPAAAKHVLRGYPSYGKGLVREVSEFLFGDGFAVAEGELWKGRRRAVVPALHKAYLEAMVRRVFTPCTRRLVDKLSAAAAKGQSIDVEACFSQLTLDIIGISVFNYDYNALSTDRRARLTMRPTKTGGSHVSPHSPVIQAVYTALKETEQRATDLLPIWKARIRDLNACLILCAGNDTARMQHAGAVVLPAVAAAAQGGRGCARHPRDDGAADQPVQGHRGGGARVCQPRHGVRQREGPVYAPLPASVSC